MESRNGLCALLVDTQLHLAEALLARRGPGDPVRAHGLVAATKAEAERLGMRPIVERAATLLA